MILRSRMVPTILVFSSFLVLVNSYSAKKFNTELAKKTNSTTSLQFPLTCSACTAGVYVMSQMVRYDFSEPVILKFAEYVCRLFVKVDAVVCDGITKQFREEFFYVFRNVSRESPGRVCGILIPECADKNDPLEGGWQIDLPPKPKRIRIKKKLYKAEPLEPSPRPLRVLQLSDLHIDMDYVPGSEADCSSPVCCRTTTASPKLAAGYYGSVGNCDVPYRLVENMLQHINRTHEIDYVLMSGDFINHVDWNYTKLEHVKVLRNLSRLVKNYFPQTPTYWTLGNHEGVPVNSFAPHTVDSRFWPSWLYEQLASMSSPWLDLNATDTILYRGSYATTIVPGLKIISMNTGFCDVTNFFLYLNQRDPDGTMSWLVSELYKAEKQGFKVQILSHIPPGTSECLEGWSRNYYRVVNRFASTIVGQFFGHDHLSYYTVFYENMNDITSRPSAVSFAAPSVTTYSYMNPAYRIYDIDPDNAFTIVNFEDYSADLSKANEENPPQWKLWYRAKEAGMKDLSPESWNNYTKRLLDDDQELHKMLQYSFRVNEPNCDETCKANFICSLRSGHHNETLYCPSKMLNRTRL